MNKIIKVGMLLLTSTTILTACSFDNKIEPISVEQSQQNYYTAVENFTKLSLDELKAKIENNESFIVFIGKSSCKYCQRFAPKLNEATKDLTDIEIFYLNGDEEDSALFKEFANSHDIKAVPNLSYFDAGEKLDYLENASQLPVKEIKSFVEDYGFKMR